ncbi:MAG: carbonic anhydrase [Streptosporangiales bacterium]|nr:carbonic anhydrase [Streptosporangiales bacterium]
MTATDELLARAELFRESFGGGNLPRQPATGVTVVTCMDSRIDLFRLLGIGEGDAHVLRNSGGIVTTDVRRSLAISQRLMGTTEVVLIQHTDCGMLTFTDAELDAALRSETGRAPDWSGGAFTDLEVSVRQSINQLRGDPFVPHRQSIRGFVYDVDKGSLREIDPG